MLRNVRVDFLFRYTKTRRYSVGNSLVRLVRNYEIDIIDRVARLLEHFRRDISHRSHRNLEKLVAFHFEKMVAIVDGVVSNGVDGAWFEFGMTEHLSDCRPTEKQEADRCRHGIAGQAQQRLTADPPKGQGLSRFHPYLPDGDIALSGQDILDEIVVTQRHATRGHDQIRCDGRLEPRFPRARYIAHRREWDDATHPHERSRASYVADDFVPLRAAGVLTLVDDDAEIMPGVRYRRSGGHTAHHQVVMIASKGETAVFVADMFPTSVHLPEPWIMGYDLYPMETLDFKRSFRREAVERGYLVFFEHDPSTAAGRLHETDGTPAVQQVL